MTNRLRILLGASASLSLVLIGCANEVLPDEDAGTDASTTMDATMDVAKPPPVDSGKDTAAPDAGMDAQDDGATEAGLDAGDGGVADGGDGGLAPPGSPCNVPNGIEDQACGLCGKQYRACLAGGDGGYVWGAWGFCQGEVQGGCDPKVQYPDLDCGLCGKKKAVCLNNCTFDQTQQCTEPMNACPPGVTQFQAGLSCDAGGREATCGSNCQYSNLSQCLATPTPPLPITIPSVGKVESRTVNLSGALKRINTTTTCSSSTTFSSSLTAYAYLRVDNNTNQTATVSLWHSTATGGASIDSVMAAYAGANPPADNDDAARKTCLTGVNDTCSDANSTSAPKPCTSGWAGLMLVQSRAVTIPANSSINVYSAAYGTSQSGPLFLNVRTDSLQ